MKMLISLSFLDFLSSLGRVMYNSSAMTQMFSMGLMAAALWGSLYNEEDILSVRHLLHRRIYYTAQGRTVDAQVVVSISIRGNEIFNIFIPSL